MEPRDRLPVRTKLAAGVGEAASNIGINLPKNFAFPIYNLVLGVNPTLLGIALMIPRLWDAITDPLVGALSDNTRSRWGRRRPWMLAGGLLSALGILLLCVFPRDVSAWVGEGVWLGYTRIDWFYAAYLCAMSMLFYTALTLFSVPYGALTMELTSDYHERTRVMTFRTFFTYASGMLIGWLFAISKLDVFKDPVTGEQDTVKGAYAVGLLVAAILIVATLTPTLFLRERVAASASKPKIPILKGLASTLRVRGFLLIIAAYTLGFLGVIMVIGLGQYVNFFYVFGGDQKTGAFVQGWAHTTAVLLGMATTICINLFGHRFEKKTVLIACLSCSCIGGIASWFFYRPDAPQFVFETTIFGLPFKYHFHMLSISYALIWPGLAGLLVMTSSMIADVCDIDELSTGARREGTYWAVFNWIQKTAISIALLLSGGILDWVGFDAKLPAQSEQTLWLMRVAYMAVVSGSVALAIVLVLLVPISRRRMAEVRQSLQAKATDHTAQTDATNRQ